MRLKYLLAILPASASLWATAIVGIPLGPSSTPITFGTGGAVTIGGCEITTCTISGSAISGGVTLNWNLSLTTPLTLAGTPSGNTSLGTLTAPGTLVVSDSLGDTLTAISSGPIGWASNSSFTTFNIAGSLSAVSITSGPGATVLDTSFGGVPTIGEQIAIALSISCGSGTQCVQAVDPIGNVIGGTLSAQQGSATPEPASMGLIAAGIAGLAFIRRRSK